NGNTRLGGDDVDRALLASIADTGDLKPESRARLLEALIDAKHRLSTEEEVLIDLPFFNGAENFHRVLRREELEKIARPILEQTRAHCRRSLADAKLAASDLDEVILVGGQTRMP